MNILRCLTCAVLFCVVTTTKANAEQSRDTAVDLVPQFLLGLVHAPEVHKELNLSTQQVADLETLFRKVDADWLPSRNLPSNEQHAVIEKLEGQIWTWFDKSATELQRQRLRQLECHAQGNRVLLRSDIGKQIGLLSSQREKLASLARATNESRLAIANLQFGDPKLKSLQEKIEKTTKAERDGIAKILQPDQLQKLKSILGEPFDTSSLSRIYPLAPEFIPVEHWLNVRSPLSMQDLKGKVVLVHFYAFQCHNCHANFPVYQRWHKELTDKGVVVVGIQTPETKRERDVAAVEAAARERELAFPIMVDLQSDNWKAWGNTMWPCVYVVDKNGYIRQWWQGELNWKGATGDKTIEKAVNSLLAEK